MEMVHVLWCFRVQAGIPALPCTYLHLPALTCTYRHHRITTHQTEIDQSLQKKKQILYLLFLRITSHFISCNNPRDISHSSLLQIIDWLSLPSISNKLHRAVILVPLRRSHQTALPFPSLPFHTALQRLLLSGDFHSSFSLFIGLIFLSISPVLHYSHFFFFAAHSLSVIFRLLSDCLPIFPTLAIRLEPETNINQH
jgi:hypothetical protein